MNTNFCNFEHTYKNLPLGPCEVPQENFGPERFSRFWIQTDKQTDKQKGKQSIYLDETKTKNKI